MRELTSSSLEADPNLGALKPAIWRTLTRSASSDLSHIPLFVRLSFLRKLLGSNNDSVTGQDGCLSVLVPRTIGHTNTSRSASQHDAFYATENVQLE